MPAGNNLLTATVPGAWVSLTALTYLNIALNPLMCGPLPASFGPYVVQHTGTNIPNACPQPPPSPPSPPLPPTPPAPPAPPAPYGFVALLALRSSVTTWPSTLSLWQGGVDPCALPRWQGVTCSGSVITGLDVSYMGLQGTLPDLWYGLTTLRFLNVNNNAFVGA